MIKIKLKIIYVSFGTFLIMIGNRKDNFILELSEPKHNFIYPNLRKHNFRIRSSSSIFHCRRKLAQFRVAATLHALPRPLVVFTVASRCICKVIALGLRRFDCNISDRKMPIAGDLRVYAALSSY